MLNIAKLVTMFLVRNNLHQLLCVVNSVCLFEDWTVLVAQWYNTRRMKSIAGRTPPDERRDMGPGNRLSLLCFCGISVISALGAEKSNITFTVLRKIYLFTDVSLCLSVITIKAIPVYLEIRDVTVDRLKRDFYCYATHVVRKGT